MSIHQAMYAGSSALTNYGNAMTVIGNNLSNANTTAFKGSRTTFEDVLIQTVGISGTRASTQIGTGVGVSAIDQSMQQGGFSGTSVVTDLAIDGQGFFKVKDPDPGAAQLGGGGGNATSSMDTFYTRAGDFKQNLEGLMVTNAGLVLQGYTIDQTTGQRNGSTADIDLSTFQTTPPQATTEVSLGLNLQSDAAIITDSQHSTYDPNDPASYNYATPVRVYDSLGQGHNLEVHFKKTASNTWEWHAAAPSDDLTSAQAGTGTLTNMTSVTDAVEAAPDGASYTSGQLVFDSQGRLLQEGSTPITFQFTGNDSEAETQEILFNFGDALDEAGDSTNDFSTTDGVSTYEAGVMAADSSNTGVKATVQRATSFTTLAASQNGLSAGFLESLAVGLDGTVSGTYTNGETKELYQIALVDFDNEQALDQVGANLFAETHLSGVAREGEPGSGALGNVRSYTLENSNVDMSNEFVTMITTQRAFQANSRLVTVTDGMLEELIALKR
uniref:Flagellar hook protein FlgE n=1 Tax=Magnetococcus massalia (strain MO-1) TaxID=451514 RepID=A0A1S7LMP1_MAGMO|nr:putative flagellar hook protein flgE [Candidatus Magnetococcus massalia]